jgi:ParB family chromosome partitioning protein
VVEFKDKIEVVPLESVKPNPWNPRKRREQQLIDDAVRHIREVGFIGAIFVRDMRAVATHPGDWQIIDGEHRWKALKVLEADGCPIVNLGVMSDDDAKAQTLNFNIVHGEMEVVDVAYLIGSLKATLGDEIVNGRLALSDEELADLADISSFDYGTFAHARDAETPNMEAHVFHLTRAQNDDVNEAMSMVEREAGGGTKSRQLELIFADYLAGTEPVEENQNERDTDS